METTDWHRCMVFGERAERAEQFLRSGSLVGVEGSMNYESWTDDEGIKRNKATVLVDQIHFLSDLRPAPVAEAK
ncbi:MAG: single-stranded DNA-binding protein [Rhodobacterales bacterium]|nr:single-stranded DNA-binding protein [Rhodobacterales bacterium]